MSTDRLLLREHEVTAMLAISRSQLYALAKRGEIPCVRIGRCVRFPAAELQEWVQQRTVRPDSE